MKVKEYLKKAIKVIGLWLLGYAKKFWEEKLKDFLRDELRLLATQAVLEIEKLHDSVEYELKRQEIFDNLFKNMELPILLRPFRWLIKMVLQDALEKKIQGTIDKLKEVI